MDRTRLSLHYLYSYLIVIGLALLVFPKGGPQIAPIQWRLWRHHAEVCRNADGGPGDEHFRHRPLRAPRRCTREHLLVRAFFLVCIATFYAMTRDPFFLVLLAVVGFGFVWTGLSYLSERN